MKARFQLLLGLSVSLVGALPVTRAQVTWTGTAGNLLADPANWSGAPANADLVFAASPQSFITLATPLNVSSITFSASYPRYAFDATNNAVLGMGAGGITLPATGAGNVDFQSHLSLQLLAPQTWTVDGNLAVYGPVTESSSATTLTKSGTGSLLLGGTNTYSGGTTVQQGTLVLASNSTTSAGTVISGPVGTGPLALNAGTSVATANFDVSLANRVSLGDNVSLVASTRGRSALTLTGDVTTTAAGTRVHLGSGSALKLAGTLDTPANGVVTFDTVSSSGSLLGQAILVGTTGANVAGFVADGAALYFSSAASLPGAITVAAVNQGYVGVGFDSAGTGLAPSSVLGHIADPAAFDGTFGFDTGEGLVAIHAFRDDVDFSAFSSARFTIGSNTDAVVTGRLTPPLSGSTRLFRFGGGSGHLVVMSNLTDLLDPATGTPSLAAVTVTTPAARDPQMVLLRGNNTFTGTATLGTLTSNLAIDNAMVILDSPHALPGAATVGLGNRAYLGYTEAAGFPTFASFVSRLVPGGYNASSILGFDSHGLIDDAIAHGGDHQSKFRRVVTENIDLSPLGDVYIGTATAARIDGTILAPASQTLFLAGYDGGRLTITSALTATDANSNQNIDTVAVGYPISGASDKLDDGTVELTGANTYSGGTALLTGVLRVGGSSTLGTSSELLAGPLGTGALTVSNSTYAPALAANTLAGTTLYNPINLAGTLRLGEPFDDKLRNGLVTADQNLLVLNGAISGPGSLEIFGRVVLNGANAYTGGTSARAGGVVFATVSAIPAAPAQNALAADKDAYIGIADTTSTQALFIDRFDRTKTSGTIGFDSLDEAMQTFASAIDLTGFNASVRLGSSTRAILTGAITSPDSIYRFGGGGGRLEVASTLTGATSAVVLTSAPEAPLTLWLTGTNTYQGSTTVNNSALIFTATGLPVTTAFIVGPGAYVGSADAALDTNFLSFLGHFNSNLANGIIGFDATAGMRTISTPLDLSRFVASSSNLYLGTATRLTFDAAATIALPTGATAYRFAAYKGGWLQLDLALTGTQAVVVGDPAVPATQAAPDGTASTVVFNNAANTYSGGTTLNAGRLLIGASSTVTANSIASGPLGTGKLTVAKNSFGNDTMRPFLDFFGAAQMLANDILLNADLGVGGNLELGGAITGSGELYKSGSGTLTLSGHNSFVGGIYVSEGNLILSQNDSAGVGPLSFGTVAAPTATFLSSAPTIGSLSGDDPANELILAANSVLHITQDGVTQYPGKISGAGAAVAIQGFNPNVPNRLVLGGTSAYTGGTTIGPNVTVVAASEYALGGTAAGSGSVTLNGGSKLVVAPNVNLLFNANRALVVNNGQIGGTGELQFNTTSFHVGPNVTLAPGLDVPGQLNVSLSGGATLVFDSGGAYRWELMDAKNPAGGWDTLAVAGTLDLAATQANPFNLQIATVSADGKDGLAGNFDLYSSYSWTLVTASSITGFNPTTWNLDTTAFLNTRGAGLFSLSVNDPNAATSLLLNYSPSAVPEPSTWALLVTGLVVVSVATRRRRRR